MIKLLQNIYGNVKAKVKTTDGLSETFACNSGVRQGCTLSPWLFAMYINELATEIENSGGNGIFIHENFHNVMLLLFADDLALVADTPNDLQRRLNNLEKYCEKWKMTINMDKSNIVVFKNGGKLFKNEKWYFKNESLKVVSYYKYLGIYFSNRLTWTCCCKTLRIQREKALNMIKHCMCKLGTRDINLGFKLFDSVVAPILYYGAELWDTEKVKDIETVQNKFGKWLLGMGQKTNNHIERGECGRHELYINYVCKPIKYFLHLQCMDDSRLLKLCYRMMFKMNEHGRINWCSKVQGLLFSNGFGVVWENQGVGDTRLFMNLFKQRLKDINLQTWSDYIGNSSKCAFYSKVKDYICINENIQKLSLDLKFFQFYVQTIS
ncbi:unnamed protein product [Mytilus coruscus]|uniref:Reverse transcriptase domain-containing protein n=1 Tax=Mytilus coruscus TaxID=42192 RepID=A0A6J8D8V9_MYTCO|nr:unnamed protein product [Mytilus coruscus]